MQAVILAAGKSSRFVPFNETLSHKALTLIMGKPILIHTVESVAGAGIKDIVLIVSKNSDVRKILGTGKDFGTRINYIIQEEPTGAGNGLLLAKELIKGDFFLLNASRVDFGLFSKDLVEKKENGAKAALLGRKQEEIGKFGVLKIKGDKVLDLVEKPTSLENLSKIRLIGIYLFSKDFLNILANTPIQHYSLEEAISKLAKKEDIRLVISDLPTSSLKYPWDLLEVKDFILTEIKGKNISKSAKIARSSEIIGDVIIEDNVEVKEGAKIKGPCFIGKNSFIGTNSIVRNGTVIEEDCTIGAYMEIKNTLMMKNSKAHSGFIGDSIVGENVRIGAQFATANVRLDRTSVKTRVKGEKIDTHLRSLGAIIGNNVKIGIKSSTMPGVIIGNNCVIGPSTIVSKNIASNTKYYSKFQEVITEK